jgi:hypothetical protein
LVFNIVAARNGREHSRYVVGWKLRASMCVEDVTASRIERRATGHNKTNPTAVQLTTFKLDYRSGACHLPITKARDRPAAG